MLMECASEFCQLLPVCYVDLKKAYDSVNHEAMRAALELKFGFRAKVLNNLNTLHKETSGAVRAYGKVSEECFIKMV